ncbi:hypothetical protein [Piscinibacter sp.]|jgi:hypothetical protein|uniref:hypothetical protein n=1 Tax=Piscinibacter sp. TaxID=1903157 RepID=UPI00355A74A4
MTTTKQSGASWSEVKAKLADLDRAALLALVHALYAASKDNQSFLHARFGLGGDVLKPYKATISRWLWPDVFRNQDTSVAKAKKAITDYKKANAEPSGLAELMVFYCEQAAGFGADVGMDDEAYLGALVRMFEQALKAIAALPAPQRPEFLSRLEAVRSRCDNIGYGVGDDMDQLWAERGRDS